MIQTKYLLSSDDCLLLVALETAGTIEKTAKLIRKDASGVSRQLSAIAHKFPALEKRAGKWLLTPAGKQLNSLTLQTIETQKQIAEEVSVIRLGTNREFASRIMGRRFNELQKIFPKTQIVLLTFEQGTEEAILTGRIDIGIDCDRPNDPDIAYKQIIPEPVVAVCSPEYKHKYAKEISREDFLSLPHLICDRLHPEKLLSKQSSSINVVAYLNDISATREVCLGGYGWCFLPMYSVADELKSKKLVLLSEVKYSGFKYGIWWSRTRSTPKDLPTRMCDWLKNIEL